MLFYGQLHVLLLHHTSCNQLDNICTKLSCVGQAANYDCTTVKDRSYALLFFLQGMGTAVLAAILGSLPRTGGSLADHTVMLSGEGPATSCIAELLAAAIAHQTGTTVLEARQNLWLVDSKGLVTRGRGDSSTLEDFKLPYCHSGPPDCVDLLTAIKTLKPTVLIGCTTQGSVPFRFDQGVVGAMCETARHPLILPLTTNDAECSAADGYAWSQARGLFAFESPSEIVKGVGERGKDITPSQVTSTYIFPGVGEWGNPVCIMCIPLHSYYLRLATCA